MAFMPIGSGWGVGVASFLRSSSFAALFYGASAKMSDILAPKPIIILFILICRPKFVSSLRPYRITV